MSPEKLGQAVLKYSSSKAGRDLFKLWTVKREPDQGACYAIAHACKNIAPAGKLHAVGYIFTDYEGNKYDRPTHIAFELNGVFMDGRGVYESHKKALASFRKKYFAPKPWAEKLKVFLRELNQKDVDDWLWLDHPRFVTDIELGIRAHLEE